jgi:hypothetical protein
MTSEYLLEIENNQRTKPSWQRMNNNTIHNRGNDVDYVVLSLNGGLQ